MGDRFKNGDIVVRVRGVPEETPSKWEPIGIIVEVLGVEGDGIPYARVLENSETYYINDDNYELHEVTTSPLFKALT